MPQYKGGCLCGSCRCVITAGKLEVMYLCHCSRCRKETGTVHAANVFLSHASLSWEQGQDNITYFKLENTRKQRAFCKTCGSPLPIKQESNVTLPGGMLDNDISLDPTAHLFYANRASWEDKLKDLKQFDELPKSD